MGLPQLNAIDGMRICIWPEEGADERRKVMAGTEYRWVRGVIGSRGHLAPKFRHKKGRQIMGGGVG